MCIQWNDPIEPYFSVAIATYTTVRVKLVLFLVVHFDQLYGSSLIRVTYVSVVAQVSSVSESVKV
jgi:hypothetical protein